MGASLSRGASRSLGTRGSNAHKKAPICICPNFCRPPSLLQPPLPPNPRLCRSAPETPTQTPPLLYCRSPLPASTPFVQLIYREGEGKRPGEEGGGGTKDATKRSFFFFPFPPLPFSSVAGSLSKKWEDPRWREGEDDRGEAFAEGQKNCTQTEKEYACSSMLQSWLLLLRLRKMDIRPQSLPRAAKTIMLWDSC